MKHRPEQIDDVVAKLARVDDEQLASLSQSPAAQALFEEVTAVEHTSPASDPVPTKSPRRRLRIAVVVAALAVVSAVAFGIVADLRQAPPAAAAVEFRTSGSFIVATVENPFAAERQLDAAFAAHELNITLKLVPVSPSMVGSVVYMGSSADASEIGVLYSKTKQAPGGPLPIGLRIPVDFKGQADIVLGRAARPGETYVSTGDAFAPGEVLHGSGLMGMRVSAALIKLRALGLSAEWRDLRVVKPAKGGLPTPVASPAPGISPRPSSSATPVSEESVAVDPKDILNNVVIGADPLAPGRVLIFTQAQKPVQP
jgi:hypothetical protein